PKTVCDEALFGFPMGNDARFLRVRTKDADDEIVTHAMRPEDAERIRVRASEEEIQLVDGHAGYFEGTHARFNLGSSAQNVARAFHGGCILAFSLVGRDSVEPHDNRAPSARQSLALPSLPINP